MLTYMPNSISRKAIALYFCALAAVSVLFINYVLPFGMVLFGIVEVCAFFYFSTELTIRWRLMSPKRFLKKLFWTSLAIRLVYMVFVYYYYEAMTGVPFMYGSADEYMYFNTSTIWRLQGIKAFRMVMQGSGLDDIGEIYFTALLCRIFGAYILTARVGHSVVSALTCVLIYRIGKRHFGEATGRMAGIFCMLMPNLIYYCGIHLKEADMVFVTVLFVDAVDMLISRRTWDWKLLLLVVASGFALFTFRSVLGAVGLVSLGVALAFNKGQIGSLWKRIALAIGVVIVLATTSIGMRLMNEMDSAWSRREFAQEQSMESRSHRGNSFAKYGSTAVFAPLIFTIPLPSMVYTEGQQNQQMLHGGNFVKNVMSGFTIFAMALLLLSGEWRKHTLPIAMMIGYLIVIASSNFAHSERFHQPALPFELLFAAFGISQLKAKHSRWIDYWLIILFLADIGWAWIKLAGRGLA